MGTRRELLRELDRQGLEAVVEASGEGWTITAPALGARILGAGIGGENALWVAPPSGGLPSWTGATQAASGTG